MASSFGQYTQGIQGVQGISEAGANIARITQSGYADFGKSLADGIKAYNENDQKNQILTGQLQGLASQYQEVYDMYSKNPEMKGFADTLKPTLDKLNKFGELSLSQKQGAVLAGQAAYASIAPHLQMYKDNALSMTQQGVQSALDAKVKVKDERGAEIESLPFQPDKSVDWNIENNRRYFELTKQNNKNLSGFNTDSALGKLADGWSLNFSNDAKLGTDNPKQRDTILKSISDWKKTFGAGGAMKGETDWSSPDGMATTSSADAYFGATVAPNDAVIAEALAAGRKGATGAPSAPLVTATQKFETAKTEVQKTIDALTAEENKWNDRATKFHDGMTSGGTPSASQYKQSSWLSKQAEDARTKREAAQAKLEAIKPESFKDDVAPVDTRTGIEKLSERVAEGRNAATKDVLSTSPVLNGVAKQMQTDIAEGISPIDFNTKSKNQYLTPFFDSVKDKTYIPKSGPLAGQEVPLEALYRFNVARIEGHEVFEGKNFELGDVSRYGQATKDFMDSAQGKAMAEQYGKLTALQDTVREKLGFGSWSLKGSFYTGNPLAENDSGREFYTPIGDEARKTAIDALEKQRVTTEKTTAKIAATPAVTGAQVLTEKPSVGGRVQTAEEKLAQPFDYSLKIKEGIETTSRDMTYAEEKQFVRKWFVDNNKGIVPSSLDAVYRAIRPETDVQFMPAPDGGQVMITSKGAQYIPPVKGEVVSDKTKSEHSLYNYGAKDPSTGRYQFEERVKGSGIYLAGFAGGGEKRAQDFAQVGDDVAKLRRIVPQLKALFQKSGHSLQLLNKDDYGKATSLIALIKAAIRVETVGTGPVALPEHQMIQERIGDPREFFALDKISIDKLDTLMRTAQDTLQNNSAGVSVRFKPTADDAAGVEREARIQAAQNQPR